MKPENNDFHQFFPYSFPLEKSPEKIEKESEEDVASSIYRHWSTRQVAKALKTRKKVLFARWGNIVFYSFLLLEKSSSAELLGSCQAKLLCLSIPKMGRLNHKSTIFCGKKLFTRSGLLTSKSNILRQKNLVGEKNSVFSLSNKYLWLVRQ